jgi:hypothetical protein
MVFCKQEQEAILGPPVPPGAHLQDAHLEEQEAILRPPVLPGAHLEEQEAILRPPVPPVPPGTHLQDANLEEQEAILRRPDVRPSIWYLRKNYDISCLVIRPKYFHLYI